MRRRMPLVAVVLALFVTVPASAWAAPAKHVDKDGTIPPRWDLPKPEVGNHADEAPESAGGDGSGSNYISFSSFESGDIIVALGTATGHAGEWDSYYYTGLYGKCIWSANTTPLNGVQLEAPIKYRGYDYAYGLWVPSVSSLKRASARNYCRYQRGEPYSIVSSKSDQTRWYCSKLAWSSYRFTSYIDLDADGGFWVWPVDLVNDPQTSVFAYGA